MLIGGTRVNEKAPRDRNLAMVFQNYALYPHLNVFENIAFPLRLKNAVRAGGQGAGHRGRGAARAHRAPRPQAGEPLRRAAPAGGDGPGHRPQGRRVPLRRAAVQPGREAARADAHRDRPHAAPARHDDRLRHPRPDRGDDAGRPDRGAAQGHPAAGRLAARPVRGAGEPVRRRLHRLAADELRPRADRATARSRRRSARSRPRATVERVGRPRPGDPRHPPGVLRGRLPGRRRRRGQRADVHRRRSTSPSGWATSSTPTCPTRRRPRSPSSSRSWSASWTASRCAPSSSCRPGRRQPDPGGTAAELWFDADRVHVFDPATGENLTRYSTEADRAVT